MAVASFVISLEQYPNYTFRTDLDGVEFVIGLRYLARTDSWLFDLFASDGQAIVTGLAVVLHQPLLVQIVDPRRPKGELFFFEDGNTGAEAGFSDLGTRVKLWYVTQTPDETEAAA